MVLELRGKVDNVPLSVYKALAQGYGLVKGGQVVVSNADDVDCEVKKADSTTLSSHQEIIDAICECVEGGRDAVFPPSTDAKWSTWVKKAEEFEFQITDDASIDELEAIFKAEKNTLTGDKLVGPDFILFASLKSWMLTSTGAQKATHRSVLGFYNGIAKSENFKKEPAPAPQQPVDTRPLDDVTRFDIVVGKVTKAWPHPEADALYCEEIDCGESEVRKIASGLRAFVKQEELEGAMVLVLANMKVKALRGYPSHGMILCASNDDHTQVQLMRPPQGAKPGDRVRFFGLDHEQGPDAQLSGKKGQEPIPVIMPNLHTDADCIGAWKTFKMTVNGEPCKCDTLANAHIS